MQLVGFLSIPLLDSKWWILMRCRIIVINYNLDALWYHQVYMWGDGIWSYDHLIMNYSNNSLYLSKLSQTYRRGKLHTVIMFIPTVAIQYLYSHSLPMNLNKIPLHQILPANTSFVMVYYGHNYRLIRNYR